MTLQSSKLRFLIETFFTRARLENLVKSASLYKTKACGTVRATNPSSRVIIEQQSLFTKRRGSNTSAKSNQSRGKVTNSNQKNSGSALSNRRQNKVGSQLDVSPNTNISNSFHQQPNINSECVFKPDQYSNSTVKKQYLRTQFSHNKKPQNSFNQNDTNSQRYEKAVISPYQQSQHNLTSAKKQANFRQSSFSSALSGRQSNYSQTSSIKSFSQDAEFIEFLKNISLYVTGGNGDSPQDQSSKLFKNLEYLRECFQEYKKQKDERSQRSQQSSMYANTTINERIDLSDSFMNSRKNSICENQNEFQPQKHPHPQTITQFSTNKSDAKKRIRSPFSDQTSEVTNIETHGTIMPPNQSDFKVQSNFNTNFTSNHRATFERSNTIKATSTPSQSNVYETLRIPEKQRKQIEFIDEIYNKVVLKKDEKSELITPRVQFSNQKQMQNQFDVSSLKNLNNDNYQVFEPQPRMFELQPQKRVVEISNFSPSGKNIVFSDEHVKKSSNLKMQRQFNEDECDTDAEGGMTQRSFSQISNLTPAAAHPYQVEIQPAQAFSHNISKMSGLYVHTPSMISTHQQPSQSLDLQSQSTFYYYPQNSGQTQSGQTLQLQETLKTLNETAQQLKNACQGITQFTSEFCNKLSVGQISHIVPNTMSSQISLGTNMPSDYPYQSQASVTPQSEHHTYQPKQPLVQIIQSARPHHLERDLQNLAYPKSIKKSPNITSSISKQSQNQNHGEQFIYKNTRIYEQSEEDEEVTKKVQTTNGDSYQQFSYEFEMMMNNN